MISFRKQKEQPWFVVTCNRRTHVRRNHAKLSRKAKKSLVLELERHM